MNRFRCWAVGIRLGWQNQFGRGSSVQIEEPPGRWHVSSSTLSTSNPPGSLQRTEFTKPILVAILFRLEPVLDSRRQGLRDLLCDESLVSGILLWDPLRLAAFPYHLTCPHEGRHRRWCQGVQLMYDFPMRSSVFGRSIFVLHTREWCKAHPLKALYAKET